MFPRIEKAVAFGPRARAQLEEGIVRDVRFVV